jgi:cardiolipin synthase
LRYTGVSPPNLGAVTQIAADPVVLKMRDKSYRFPWRGNNRFTLLVDGGQFYPAMLEAIRAARSHVLLEMYLVTSGRVMEQFVEALCEAVTRAKVYLLLDDFGAHGLTADTRLRLMNRGVHLAVYNPLRYRAMRHNLLRDHRKLLLVDGRIAFLGGMGITDPFWPQGDAAHGWHDVAIQVEGGCVADWQEAFVEIWRRTTRVGLDYAVPALTADIGPQVGRATVAQGPYQAEMQRSLVTRTRQAERRVWLATAYFVPSRKIRRCLRRAAVRGVDVRLLLPGPHTDHPAIRHAGRRFYSGLLRHGVRIFEYQPRFLHA